MPVYHEPFSSHNHYSLVLPSTIPWRHPALFLSSTLHYSLLSPSAIPYNPHALFLSTTPHYSLNLFHFIFPIAKNVKIAASATLILRDTHNNMFIFSETVPEWLDDKYFRDTLNSATVQTLHPLPPL